MNNIRSMEINKGLVKDTSFIDKEEKIVKVLKTMNGISFNDLIDSLGLKSELTIVDASELGYSKEENRYNDKDIYENELLDLFMVIRLLVDSEEYSCCYSSDLEIVKKIRSLIHKGDSVRLMNGLPSYHDALQNIMQDSVSAIDIYHNRDSLRVISEVERIIKNELSEKFLSAEEIIKFRNRYAIPSFRNFVLKLQSICDERIDMSDIYNHIDEISYLFVTAQEKSVSSALAAFKTYDGVRRICPNKSSIKKINVSGFNSEVTHNCDVCSLLLLALDKDETDSDILNLLCDASVLDLEPNCSITYMKK